MRPNRFRPRKEAPVLVREIISSCSHPNVAQAALASIGGQFALRFETHADSLGLKSGSMAAQAVRRFADAAQIREWDLLRHAMAGSDQPVLAGFRHILEISLEHDVGVVENGETHAAKGGMSFAAIRTLPEAPCHAAF